MINLYNSSPTEFSQHCGAESRETHYYLQVPPILLPHPLLAEDGRRGGSGLVTKVGISARLQARMTWG